MPFFRIFIWFLFILELFTINEIAKKGILLPVGADVARRRLTWRAGPTQGATRHWGHVAEPGRPTRGAGGADAWQEATQGGRSQVAGRPLGHVGARVGRHVQVR